MPRMDLPKDFSLNDLFILQMKLAGIPILLQLFQLQPKYGGKNNFKEKIL